MIHHAANANHNISLQIMVYHAHYALIQLQDVKIVIIQYFVKNVLMVTIWNKTKMDQTLLFHMVIVSHVIATVKHAIKTLFTVQVAATAIY